MNSSPLEGFLYERQEIWARLPEPEPGMRLHADQFPYPQIFVNHTLEDVIVAHWPGRLWLARAVDLTEHQYSSKGISAYSVDLIDEVPTARLFGDHGIEVERVLSVASRLDGADFLQLAGAHTDAAARAYAAGWKRWAAERWPGGDAESMPGDTVAIHPGGSPIGDGFSLLHGLVREWAEREIGPSAFDSDEEETCLAEPWSTASSTLLHAAMALGAPELLDASERVELLRAWSQIYDAVRRASS